MSVRTVRKIFAIAVVLLPLLSLYRGIGYSIDFGTVCVLVLFLFNVFCVSAKMKASLPKDWIVYLTYVVTITAVVIFISKGSLDVMQMVQRLLKNVLYIIIFLVSYENEFYMVNYARKSYMIVVGITTIYVYLQAFAARFMNIILWGYIPNLVRKISYVEDIKRTSPLTFRPSSLFYEPSHYFIYVFVALTLLLFSEEKCNIKKIGLAMFVSGGVVLSTTSMGIIFIAILWLIWGGWKSYKNYKKGKTELVFLVICILGVMAVALMLNSAKVINSLARVFDASYKGGNAIAGRGMGYYEITKMPFLNFFFGYGYGNVGSNYYPSMAFNFLCLGVVGCFLIFVVYYNIYVKITLREEKIAFLMYIALCFYGEIFMSYYLLFFMCMFMHKEKRENTKFSACNS